MVLSLPDVAGLTVFADFAAAVGRLADLAVAALTVVFALVCLPLEGVFFIVTPL
jgi:hypothetical protein